MKREPLGKLLAAVRSGDEAAFTRLIARLYGWTTSRALRVVAPHHWIADPESVARDAALDALAKARTAPPRPVPEWIREPELARLSAMARDAATERVRSMKVRRHVYDHVASLDQSVAGDEGQPTTLGDLQSGGRDPAEIVAARVDALRILASLTGRERDVVVRVAEGAPHAEVGEELGLSEKQVTNAFQLARERAAGARAPATTDRVHAGETADDRRRARQKAYMRAKRAEARGGRAAVKGPGGTSARARAAALAAGDKTYRGAPCAKCSRPLRYVSNSKCVACARAAQRNK